jgi:hypothetical protein
LEKLKNENLLLVTKRNTVEDYIKEKSNLEEKLLAYEKKIEQINEAHRHSLYELEKQSLIEKNKLRVEMIERLNDLANEFRNAFHQQMNNTTKKIIKENYSLNLDLKKLTATVSGLLDENETLKEQVRERQCKTQQIWQDNGTFYLFKNLKSKVELNSLGKIENELTKKYVSCVKVLQMQMTKELIQEDLMSELEANRAEIASLKQENAKIRQELSAMQRFCLVFVV